MTAQAPTSPQTIAGQQLWVMAKGYLPDEGGMQSYARGVAESYAAMGAQVTVFTQTSAGPRRERVGVVDVVDVGANSGPSLPFRLRAAMHRQLRDGGPPVLVHGTTWRTSLLPMAMGLPFVTTFHGREFMYGGAVAIWLMRRVAARARAIFAVSRYSADRLSQRLGPGVRDAVVAWNGVDIPAGTAPVSQPGGVPLLFSLCRLEPRKNIAACVRAAALLRDDGHAFRYVIAGRGPELDAVRQLVADLRLTDRVEVAGFVSAERAGRLYADADVFLHPQLAADGGRDFEGFGIAIADAMAAGCVPVVGQEGGAAELVQQGRTGFAVDGRDVGELAAVVAGLLQAPDATKRMANAAKAHAQATFTWDRHAALIVDAAGVLPGRALGKG